MKDEIDELKELEKQVWKDAGLEEEYKKTSPSNRNFRLGVGLIIIGVVAMIILFSGVNVWNFWWLLFFIKPLLFGGWGFGHRATYGGWPGCHSHSKQQAD